MITSVTTDNPKSLSHRNDHDWCLVCGESNPWSAKLEFQADDNGVVSASFQSHRYLQGYKGIMHGGVIAALLDAAMTHCLFYHNVQGLTCNLQVRFVHSVPCDARLDIRAHIVNTTPRLFRLKAELLSEKRVAAWAEGKFLRRQDST